MAWTAPRTYTAGEVITASIGNTHWRDNLRYLKGLDGTVTLSDGLDLGANELTINSVEIVGTDGEVNKAAIEQLDHGADLDGLSDDDHTQYALRTILTTRGDIVYRNATVWARLAVGGAGTYLYSNGTDPSWVAGTVPQNGIIIWAGTIANIPAGFVICDGNNATPNLLTRFVEGVATAATDPGATGGNVSHTHTLPQSANQFADNADTTPVEGANTGSTDGRPPYYDVAFIMKT